MLFTVPATDGFDFLRRKTPQKTILYSGFQNLYKKIREIRKLVYNSRIAFCIKESEKAQDYAQKPQQKIKNTVQEFHLRITPHVNSSNDQFDTTDNAI